MFEFVQNNKIVIRIILGAVALTFVGFGVSSYTSAIDDPYLAKVGDTKIYKQDLDRALEGQPADPASREQALNGLIRRELLLQDARNAGLGVSDAALQQAILAIPEFQENGKFSKARYAEFLKQRSMTAEVFQERLSRDILLQQQMAPFLAGQIVPKSLVERTGGLLGETRTVRAVVLKPDMFAAEVDTSDKALKAYYDANLARYKAPDQVKLDYVVLSQAAVAAALPVSDADLQAFYDQHKAEFSKNEERRASHILLSVPQGAKPEEKARIKAEAEKILKEVRANPASFAAIAKSRSQDPGSAVKGGDLGYFAQGTMVKPFNDAVFAMKAGQISDVIETEFGFHIIRLDSVKVPDFASLKPRLLEQLQARNAGARYRQMADRLGELAYQQGDSLDPIVKELKLEVRHSDWMSRSVPGPDAMLANPKVLDAAFGDDVLKKKHNSEPVDVGNNTLVVVRVAGHQAAHQLSLDEVKGRIRTEIVAREGAKLAEKKGAALLADLKSGKEPAGYAFSPALTVSRSDNKGMPLSDLKAIFSIDGAKVPGFAGAKHDTGEYVVYRLDKVEAAPAITEGQREQLVNILGQMTANAQAESYLKSLLTKYKVTVNRKLLGEQ
ncbi:SurA N-terminal domain-containing protein [Paludibacterium paludis]|uniref:Periplasmic chaperone PpiD n=1 Tax=Paludibacterium paludis TaxID=1225769 RepID=A0A918P1F7_9NEIS|nr:SurA N-terminal domain-containing protein [Paludibacterium paludis]GGY13607.1 peptidylprolyl isomerase [Paludibacterium paludis]